MKQWPKFDSNGDLPVGIHQATLAEVRHHFGTSTLHRRLVARRLEEIYNLARGTGQLARFIVFGSWLMRSLSARNVINGKHDRLPDRRIDG